MSNFVSFEKKTGKELLEKITSFVNTFYGESFLDFNEKINKNNKYKLSLADFLLKTNNNNFFEKINNNNNFKYHFISRLINLAELTNFDFTYCYCFLQGERLRFDIQYQEKLKILNKKGFKIKIDYVLKDDIFNEKIEIKESKAIYSYNFEKKNYSLMSVCQFFSNEEKGDKIIKEAKDKFDNEFYFAIALIEKDGNTDLYKISKNEVYASLKSSLSNTCFKEKIGLKAMMDIAIIHIIYNRIINNSLSSEDDEYISQYSYVDKENILLKNVKTVVKESNNVEETEDVEIKNDNKINEETIKD